MTIKEIIEYLESIPEDRWCVGEYSSGSGKCCAAGHLFRKSGSLYEAADALMLTEFRDRRITSINDGLDADYQQPTPKARVMAFFRDVESSLNRKDTQSPLGAQ